MMGQITIRNLDDAVIAALKRRAAAAGRSMEEEARRALTASVGQDADREALIARMRAVAARIGRVEGPSSAEIIREMRDERSEHLARLSGERRRARDRER